MQLLHPIDNSFPICALDDRPHQSASEARKLVVARSRKMNLGAVVALWRYPVKSMMGEELNSSQVTERGLLGDRAYALIDNSDGKAATAKNPRKWPHLFDFRATFTETVEAKIPPVRISLPDGRAVMSDQADLNEILSQALNRDVTLRDLSFRAAQMATIQGEEYRPLADGQEDRAMIGEFTLSEGTFFDGAIIHLMTTSTLDHLRDLYPQGHFDPRRFRPNIVVALGSGEKSFAENAWVGSTLAIGPSVRLNITRLCGRCVMTTLPQGHLPRDPEILRTVARHNQSKVGAYAAVLQGGVIRRGDAIKME